MDEAPVHSSQQSWPPPVSTRQVPRQATSAVAYAPAPLPEDDDPLLGFAPFLHPQPRSNSITPELQRRFVATLAATGIVNQAARSIGKSMEALYRLRARPGAEGFAGAWDAALERGMHRLEDCALERSLKGTATPIVSGGTILGWWDKPDNGLLRFLLQHRLPGRYGVQNLAPGHPVYESIRAEVRAEMAAEQAVREAEARERSLRAELARERARGDRAERALAYAYEEEDDEGDASEADGMAAADAMLRADLAAQYPTLTEQDLDEIMGCGGPDRAG